jgi:hypothetical protein
MQRMFEFFVRANRDYRDQVSRIDADTMLGADARRLAVLAEEMKRTADALLTIAIARVNSSGAWAEGKSRSAEDWVSRTTGASWGEAKGKVELANSLRSLPETTEALVEGRISGTQAALVAQAAAIDPHAEHRLLDLANRAAHTELRDAARRVVATASGQIADEQAAVHRTRYLRTWTGTDGAFCLQGRLTKADGAKVLAVLEPLMEIEFTNARRQGRREQPDAYRADALVVMAERAEIGSRSIRRARAAAKAAGASDSGAIDAAVTDAHAVADDRDVPTPKAHIIVRVDHHALLRGHVEGDETCEIEGIGPVPVSDVEQVMGDAYLTILRTKGRDVLAATTMTRIVRPELRRALEARDRVCVVPGCGIASGLEIDHLEQFAKGGPTSIDNLQRLCRHHHRLKTTGKATLTRWETPDGPQFGWLPRMAEAEDPTSMTGRTAGAPRPRAPRGLGDPEASEEMFPDTGTG